MGELKIDTQKDPEVLYIVFPKLMDKNYSNKLSLQVKEWLIQPYIFYILDFSDVKEIKQSCYPTLLQFQKNAKQNHKTIITIKLNEQILMQVKNDGIMNALNIVENEEKFIADFRKALLVESKETPIKHKIDVNLINPFLSATKMIIETEMKTSCDPDKPYLADVNNKTYIDPIAIVGIMTITTDKFKGSITLAFPEDVFIQIYNAWLGETSEKITPEMQDAAAELLNIIYGTAKSELNSKEGYQLKPVLPTILIGEKLNIRQQTMNKIIILPFSTVFGKFQIEISNEALN